MDDTTEIDGLLPCVEVNPPQPADAAVIWLHGLGADGHDFVPALPYLGLPEEHAIRFVFPNAPSIPVTLNGGFVMPAWYDITDEDLANRHDIDGLRTSAASVQKLVERERENGIDPSRIVLAGFSQGGAVALHLGLRYDDPLAGLVALSTYLVAGETLEDERSDANLSIRILQCHGHFDPMVAFNRGETTRDALVAAGYGVEWHSYPMQHEVCGEELQRIGAWLQERLYAES